MQPVSEALIGEVHDLAVTIGTRAAEIARSRRAGGIEVAYSKSAIADIVTDADRETEQFVRHALAEARPDDGFLGEEFDAVPSASGLTWVVDPIDGTVNYLYGLDPCAVSIAVVEGDPTGTQWRAIAGVVVNIFSGRVYSAAVGRGAWADGDRLAVATTTSLPVTLVATGFQYAPEVRVRQARVLANLLGTVRDIRRFGAAAIDLCLLAEGKVDLFYEIGLKPWDFMAGALIAQEAGAIVRGRGGSTQLNGEFLIAANAALIDQLQPMIEDWLSAEGF